MIEYLVSVDPGKYELGIAVYKYTHDPEALTALMCCSLLRIPRVPDEDPVARWYRMATEVTQYLTRQGVYLKGYLELAAERMVIRPSRLEAANAVSDLQGVLGAVSYAIDPADATSYLPEQWKRQLPKAVTYTRVLEVLTAFEVATLTRAMEIEPKRFRHNVVDAVGIGLHHLGRRLV